MATEEHEDWLLAIKAKGHIPRLEDDGTLNIFVCDTGHHNGPGCESCGWSCCMLCNEAKDIPECTEPVLELTATKLVD